MSPRWRVIDTGAMGPFANMAFDEALLRSYRHNSSQPTLRIYGWRGPCLSLGYSQDPDDVLDIGLCRERSVPFVRRITGGGIILHGNELTYSLVCSREDLGIQSQVEASYKAISSFLISFYGSLGIDAAFARDISAGERLGASSALCFAAKEKYDIVVDGKKMGGSAQKRSRDVIFQHGSIPLNFNAGQASSFLRSKATGKNECFATCLEELLGIELKVSRLSQLLMNVFVRSFNVDISQGDLSDKEKDMFTRLKKYKYESNEWNYKRMDKTAKATIEI